MVGRSNGFFLGNANAHYKQIYWWDEPQTGKTQIKRWTFLAFFAVVVVRSCHTAIRFEANSIKGKCKIVMDLTRIPWMHNICIFDGIGSSVMHGISSPWRNWNSRYGAKNEIDDVRTAAHSSVSHPSLLYEYSWRISRDWLRFYRIWASSRKTVWAVIRAQWLC